MKRFTYRDSKGQAVCRGITVSGLVECTEIVGGEAIERFADLEDKIESGQLVELPTIISFPDTHPFLGKITTYQVVWLDELLGIRHENYTFQEQAEARLKELKGEE